MGGPATFPPWMVEHSGVAMKRGTPDDGFGEEAPKDLYLVLLVLLLIFSACSSILHLDPWRGGKPDNIIG